MEPGVRIIILLSLFISSFQLNDCMSCLLQDSMAAASVPVSMGAPASHWPVEVGLTDVTVYQVSHSGTISDPLSAVQNFKCGSVYIN